MSTFSETASQLRSKVSEMRDDLGDLGGPPGKNWMRNETAAGFHAAASSVRTTGRHSSEKIDTLATSAAEKLDVTASYIQDHDIRGLIADMRHFIRRHPTRSLMVASGIGFFGGFAVRQATHSCTRGKG
jgi:ElaB/YqjD/DUF883 family membrane-anchored ribosome-binding protein